MRRYSPALLLAALLALPTRGDVPLGFDLERRNQLKAMTEADGVVAFETAGEDPFVLLRPFDREAAGPEDHVLAFEYFCPDGLDSVEVYFGPPIVAGGFLAAGPLPKSESWQPFAVNLAEASHGRWTRELNLLRLDLGRRSGVRLRVRNLRLRVPTESERRSIAEREAVWRRKEADAAAVTRYLAAAMPVKIESVVFGRERVEIEARQSGEVKGELRLIESPPWHEPWNGVLPDEPALAAGHPLTAHGNRLTASILRFDGDRDRITSRWSVVEKLADGPWRLVSHRVYPTDLSAACEHPELDRKVADGIKGMGGVWANDILNELVELGVKHITDNVFISRSFSGEARPGWQVFRHDGRDWWVEPSFVHGHDRLVKFATDHGMIVSAIVLVGFGSDGFAGMLQHPAADRAGHYAMPNLTTPEGVAAYQAAIHFLAHRYAQPGDPHGRISNWILHNEVDYGWEWTNMGAQPLAVYLDTYVRSMRIVHNLARRFNPHARTFISLTHRWNVPDDPGGRTYGPRRMLGMLVEYSRTEGDFEWGVAYHPYPQSLFQPAAWNDTQPTDEFDTPLITPKNIAVLDRWMLRDEMRFEGRPRGVILSEQGFHTDDYGEASQRLQAAAFVYMWRQLRGLRTIEAFHNHRWVDHPAEGGLKLGLRTLPGEGKPYGDRKFAWEIYRTLDTPAEADATRFAEGIIRSAPRH